MLRELLRPVLKHRTTPPTLRRHQLEPMSRMGHPSGLHRIGGIEPIYLGQNRATPTIGNFVATHHLALLSTQIVKQRHNDEGRETVIVRYRNLNGRNGASGGVNTTIVLVGLTRGLGPRNRPVVADGFTTSFGCLPESGLHPRSTNAKHELADHPRCGSLGRESLSTELGQLRDTFPELNRGSNRRVEKQVYGHIDGFALRVHATSMADITANPSRRGQTSLVETALCFAASNLTVGEINVAKEFGYGFMARLLRYLAVHLLGDGAIRRVTLWS